MLGSAISIALCILPLLLLVAASKAGTLLVANEKLNGDVSLAMIDSLMPHRNGHLITSNNRQKRFTGNSYI